MTVPGTALDSAIALASAARKRFENEHWPAIASLPLKQLATVTACALSVLFLVFYFVCQLLGKGMGAGEMTIVAGMIAGIFAIVKFWNDKERDTDWDLVRIKGQADALVAHYTAATPPSEPPTIVAAPGATVVASGT